MTTKKMLLIVAFGCTMPLCARHMWLNDPFFDSPWIDQLVDFHDRALERMKRFSEGLDYMKDEREALKAAREALGKVVFDVKEDDEIVTLTFTGFDALDKKDVKVIW